MIYITQLIFVKKGKENIFQEFENQVIPLMEKYGGEILYRIRPEKEAFINQDGDTPYEIHFVSFESEEQLNQYIADDSRKKYIHLKEESVETMLLVKGEKM